MAGMKYLLRLGIRDLLWAMALIGMGLAWWVDHSNLAERAYYLDWKAYQLLRHASGADEVDVDEDGNLLFTDTNSQMTVIFPRAAERRKEWEEHRELSEH